MPRARRQRKEKKRDAVEDVGRSPETETTDDEGEWEEKLVYVELNDIPSVQELFAVEPDYFLRFQKKKFRQTTQPVKATHPKITIKFHGFESEEPVLQIGNRYFSCVWEESIGSALFFRKKADPPPVVPVKLEKRGGLGDEGAQRPCSSLKSIVPEPSIPWDPIFGSGDLSSKGAYELVAKADKVLKTQLLDASTEKQHKIPANKNFFGRGIFKIPRGYTAVDLMAGEYKPKKGHKRRQPGESESEEDDENNVKAASESEGTSSKSETMITICD